MKYLKFFENKRIYKKFVLPLALVILFQVKITNCVHASNVLIEPITDLFVSLADSVMAIIQDILLDSVRSRRRIVNKDSWR